MRRTGSRAPTLAAEAELLNREFEYLAEFFWPRRFGANTSAAPSRMARCTFPMRSPHTRSGSAYGILKLARAAGATVHSASPVLRWSKQGAEHRLATPHGTVKAAKVVVATNGYTPEQLNGCLRATTLPALSYITQPGR